MKLAANFKKFVMPSIVLTGVAAGLNTIAGMRAIDRVTLPEYRFMAADNFPSLSEANDASSSVPPFESTLIFFTENGVAYALSTAIIKRLNTLSGILP